MLTLSGLTASGAMVGTPAYMAPEVGTGKPGTTYSDIYALGVVLYQAITGSLPFNSESPMGIVMQHINEPAPHPSLLVPTIPPALEAVILKAMEKDPAARFTRAGEMAAALRQAMGLANPNGKITPVPVHKAPVEAGVISLQEGKTVTTPAIQSTPIIDSIGKQMPMHRICPMGTPTAIILSPRLVLLIAGCCRTAPCPGGAQLPLKNMLWGWLLVLALGIIGGGLWLGMNGGMPLSSTRLSDAGSVLDSSNRYGFT